MNLVRTLSDSISRVGLWDGRPLQSTQFTQHAQLAPSTASISAAFPGGNTNRYQTQQILYDKNP